MSSEPLCPRPANTRPDNFTMAECILAGECGCTVAGHKFAQSSNPGALSSNPIGEPCPKTSSSPLETVECTTCGAEVVRVPNKFDAPEPVAWIGDSPTKGNGKRLFWTRADAWHYASKLTPLYDHPPRSYTPMSRYEILKAMDKTFDEVEFGRAIERAVLERLGITGEEAK